MWLVIFHKAAWTGYSNVAANLKDEIFLNDKFLILDRFDPVTNCASKILGRGLSLNKT